MATLYNGTSGADTLSETTYTGDTLVGGAGDDTYHCWASSYWVSGLPGYTTGYDVYYRTDIVEQANQGYDTVYYHIGIYGITVSGSELPSVERIYLINNLNIDANFQLMLGAGAQRVYGSTAEETLSGGGGNDTIYGIGGDDSLLGGDGADSLLGGIGNDSFDGGAGADRLLGGKGSDTYYVQNAADVVTEAAGEGMDVAYLSVTDTLDPNVEQAFVGVGNINVTGNSGNNWLYAGAGNNVLTGGGGTDTVSFKVGVGFSGVTASLATGLATGGSGTDTLYGIRDIEGTHYVDSLQGNSAQNRLYGLSGNDTLNGGAGADTLIGGFGNDEYRVDNAGDSVRESVNEGTDQVFSTSSHTLRPNVENLQLDGSANINGRGNDANNQIIGNTGNNLLAGNGGADFLDGGAGNDILIAGAGYDQIKGNTGADRFQFDSVTDAWASGTKDVIWDFVSGVDRIDLSGIDANPNVAGDQAFAVDDLSYAPGTGILQADVGGNGTYDLQLQLGLFLHPSTLLVADLIL